ncbi:MAG: TldD/PmbA family protein [candidate division WOR-3 bacterium]|nr:MAG: TldD/PmbA family protein [candidate division WOR-3 bacterium]
MDQLLKLAKQQSDGVEVLSIEQNENSIKFEDRKLKDIQSTLQSGITLRLIKQGKIGFAYTKNLRNSNELIQHAMDSLKGGVAAEFNFPHTDNVPTLNSYDPGIEGIDNAKIVGECNRIYGFMQDKIEGQLNIGGGTAVTGIQIKNSSGTNLSSMSSNYYISVTILYPGSGTGIHRSLEFKNFKEVDDSFLNNLAELYKKGEKEFRTTGGRMKVLFMPEAMYTLVWRLQSATSGESLYNKQSPLADAIGKKIFDEKITIVNDPLNDERPDARAFDDEGVGCRKLLLIDKGVLRNYYYDLRYAAKMNAAPSGHGFKAARWSSDRISIKPTPALNHLSLASGNTEFWKLVGAMDRGIIVCGALGAHSGNIPNGDFSIGVSPGFYVENGEVVGRIKDAMVAGNIYAVMSRVIGIENAIHAAYTGYYPAVLFDEVNVATKN